MYNRVTVCPVCITERSVECGERGLTYLSVVEEEELVVGEIYPR